MRTLSSSLLAGSFCLLFWACGGSSESSDSVNGQSGSGGQNNGGSAQGGSGGVGANNNGGSGGSNTAGTAGTNNGGSGGSGGCSSQSLPADIKSIISAKCIACHGNPPISGVPVSLTNYTQLTAPSPSDSTKSVAQVALERMQSSTSPMPPGGAAAADVATWQAWVDAGTPAEVVQGCGGSGGSGGGIPEDPAFTGPTVCTSNDQHTGNIDPEFWPGGAMNMYPGRACIQCHQSEGEGQPFKFAGTVYPTGHEPNLCDGYDGGGDPTTIKVVVTDANGNVYEASVNSAGNFGLNPFGFAAPYTAKVVSPVGERIMATEQTSGDCNTCHTEQGANGAPGRIVVPAAP